MSTLEKLIAEARLLGSRLREHDSFADTLISQTSGVRDRLDAMKQYEEDLNKLNEIPKRRPRHRLVMEIAQESKQIRDLKDENLELKACLEEHQSALELIMTKYREQMRRFMMAKSVEQNILNAMELTNCTESVMREKICEMVKIMQRAATVDDNVAEKEHERLVALQTENLGLRELLKINKSLGINLNSTNLSSKGKSNDCNEQSLEQLDEKPNIAATEEGCIETGGDGDDKAGDSVENQDFNDVKNSVVEQ